MFYRRAFLHFLAFGMRLRFKAQAAVIREDETISEVPEGPPAPKTEIQPPKPEGDVVWVGGRWKWRQMPGLGCLDAGLISLTATPFGWRGVGSSVDAPGFGYPAIGFKALNIRYNILF